MEEQPHETAPPTDPGAGQQRITTDQQEEILRLHKAGYGTRRIAQRTGLNRKTVQGALQRSGILHKQGPPPPAAQRTTKLDTFHATINEKAKEGLSVSRILREISTQGYAGGRTILADYVRSIRSQSARSVKVRRRFETGPGEEMQVDWSVYRVPLGDAVRTVHAFSAVLHYSRKAHVRFYLDERQSTLLEAHCHAFADFEGVTARVVYDRMATVVLGQIGRGGQPIWHPRFLDFAKHYGFEPFLCRVADPDRKGGVERFFLYLERDFVVGSTFASLEEMNERVRLRLRDVANCRVQRTTRAVPDELWLAERDFLIRLPQARFATCDEELRYVDHDATLTIRGTPYTVPHQLADSNVWVRLFAEHFEVLAKGGGVAFSRRYVAERDKGKLQIDPSHYQGLSRRAGDPSRGPAGRLEEAFLVRFPTLADLVVGLKVRMKRLAHVHLRALWRLAERYGEPAFLAAASRAQQHRAFSAQVVRRILEQSGAEPVEEAISPLTASARAVALLGDVDSGSLDDYAHLDDTDGEREDGDDQ